MKNHPPRACPLTILRLHAPCPYSPPLPLPLPPDLPPSIHVSHGPRLPTFFNPLKLPLSVCECYEIHRLEENQLRRLVCREMERIAEERGVSQAFQAPLFQPDVYTLYVYTYTWYLTRTPLSCMKIVTGGMSRSPGESTLFL